MKKLIVILSGLCLTTMLSFAQNEPAKLPYSFGQKNISMNVDNMRMPAVDREALLKEDEQHTEKSELIRTGVGFSVASTLHNSGRTDITPDGGKLWRIQYTSEGAFRTYLVFDHFNIPDEAQLFIYSPDHEQVYGPYTNEEVKYSSRFETDDIIGDELVLEYYEPANAAFKGEFEVAAVMHLYKDFLADPEYSKGPIGTAEGNCHLDVVCPDVRPWNNQVKSVVCISMSAYCQDEETGEWGWGSFLCTGAMINNVRMDKTPYVLSANHCVASADQTYKFYFNYQTHECGGTTGRYNHLARNGVIVARSSEEGNTYSTSDFLLLKISGVLSTPIQDSVVFAGWDRSGAASVGIAIHHPGGDWKKASFPRSVSQPSYYYDPDKFYEVAWETNPNRGVTEQGSSGSPLFNANALIIGTLTGGSSYCTKPWQTDLYGRMSYHWTNNNATDPARKLQPWLDPDNTNAMTLSGMTYRGDVITGIQTFEQAHTFTVAPNPTRDGIVTIQGEFQQENAVCRIFNAMGQLVKIMTVTTDATFTMNVSDLNNGLYFIDLTGSERNYKSKMVIAR